MTGKNCDSAPSVMRRSALAVLEVSTSSCQGEQFLLGRVGGSPARTTEFELFRSRGNRVGRAAKATLRVKSVQVACRVRPVSREGYYAVTDALRLAVARGSSAKLGHFRVHAATFPIPSTTSRLAAHGRTTETRSRHHDQGSLTANLVSTRRGRLMFVYSNAAYEFSGRLRTTGSVMLEVFSTVACESDARRTEHIC